MLTWFLVGNSSNENRAFYMQCLANLFILSAGVEDLNLVYLGGGGGVGGMLT